MIKNNTNPNRNKRRIRTIIIVPIIIIIAAGLLTISRAVIQSSPLLSKSQRDIPGVNTSFKPGPYSITPEYNRTLKKILISLPVRGASLKYHHEFLSRLPGYTEIILFSPESNLNLIKKELKNRPYSKMVRFVLYDTMPRKGARFYLLFPEKEKLVQVDNDDHVPYPEGTFWAQDLFEVATKPGGQTLLLTSDVYKWFLSYGDKQSSRVINDNGYLASLSSLDIEVQRLPVTFDGGNILVDEFNGKRIAFCGGNVLRCTRTVWRSTLETNPTDPQIITMLKESLNADELVIVGEAKVQPLSLMFHLDQAMIILQSGVVGITNIVGELPRTTAEIHEIKEVEQFLAELRSTLLGLGYRIVDIDTSVRNILNHQQYVNAVPYINRETNEKTLFMPVFPSTQTDFEKELVKKNTDSLESLGFTVVHIPTSSDNINGGIHCLVNVLK